MDDTSAVRVCTVCSTVADSAGPCMVCGAETMDALDAATPARSVVIVDRTSEQARSGNGTKATAPARSSTGPARRPAARTSRASTPAPWGYLIALLIVLGGLLLVAGAVPWGAPTLAVGVIGGVSLFVRNRTTRPRAPEPDRASGARSERSKPAEADAPETGIGPASATTAGTEAKTAKPDAPSAGLRSTIGTRRPTSTS